MANNDGFWRGVFQSTIGNLLAGVLLLGLGRAWVGNRFDSLLGTLKNGVNQVESLQTQMNKMELTTEKPVVKKVKHHAKRHRHKTDETQAD